MIRFNNILFKSTLLVDLFPTSLVSTNQNTQVSTAQPSLEGTKAVRQREELSAGQTRGSCPLGGASLYKLLEQEPTVKWGWGVTNPAEIRDSTDILFTTKWESRGINTKDTLAWSAQKMSLILHRQVTGDPP